jgi:hypothetical protein
MCVATYVLRALVWPQRKSGGVTPVLTFPMLLRPAVASAMALFTIFHNPAFCAVKLPLFIKHHTMKTYAGVEAKFHLYSALVLDGGEWSACQDGV